MTKIISAQQGVSLFLLNGRFAGSSFSLVDGVTCFCFGHSRQGDIDESGFARMVFIPGGWAREIFSVVFPAKHGDDDFVVQRYRSDGVERISGRFTRDCQAGAVRFIVGRMAQNTPHAVSLDRAGPDSGSAGGAPRGCDAVQDLHDAMSTGEAGNGCLLKTWINHYQSFGHD